MKKFIFGIIAAFIAVAACMPLGKKGAASADREQNGLCEKSGGRRQQFYNGFSSLKEAQILRRMVWWITKNRHC